MRKRLTLAPMVVAGVRLPQLAVLRRVLCCCSELWACVVCPDLVLHVFSPEGARIYMDELIRVRDTSSGVSSGSWSPKHVDSRTK
jgi:hypothetical protein